MSTTEVEQTALNMGWIPKEKFRGDETKWVDAETYVERGQTFLPFIKAENRKLQEKLETAAGTITQLQNSAKELTDSVEALKKYNTEMNQEKVQQIRKQLLAEIAEARKDGDVVKEEELRDKLDTAKAALKTAQTTETVVEKKPNGTDSNKIDPEVQRSWNQWVQSNDWWNTNEVMRAMAVDMAGKMNASGELKPSMSPMERYEAVGKKVIARYEELTNQQVRATSKVEGGKGNDGGGSGGGKGYSALPAEAKAACERFAKDVVGKGKTYPDMKTWRDKYAADYFA